MGREEHGRFDSNPEYTVFIERLEDVERGSLLSGLLERKMQKSGLAKSIGAKRSICGDNQYC